MKLIIDIPEEVYKKAKETHDVMCDSVWLGIKYGTPLSESEDCVSRQAAIDELYKMLHDCFGADDEELDAVITTLNALPPVTPAEKVGQWIYDKIRYWNGGCKYECSECGMGSDVNYAYCMRCGCKMQEVEE